MRYIKPMNNDLDFFGEAIENMFRPMMPKEFLMRTDIKECCDNYILETEVPGFKKEEITIDFEDGYITILAKKEKEQKCEDKEKCNVKYLRRERYTGTCSRKFYVGEINENDIKASFCDGILTLSFPKESKKKETKKIINIQ
ncbi:MAG: Hsp20/alpha crystallin family protein [Clostridia bacterium]|nr:Hsp20/alpha crystallin family protein [Clostridia bacterium]